MTQDSSSHRDAGRSFDGNAALAAEERPEGVVLPLKPQPALPAQDFVVALLAAVTQMAALSPRRQADVAVAMRRTGLSAGPGGVGAALEQLQRDGCIERPLVLSDGGILVSVTMRGIERLAATSHRHVVAGMMTGGVR